MRALRSRPLLNRTGFANFQACSYQSSKVIFPSGWIALRSRLIEKGIIVKEENSYRFIQDYLFASPSAASSILLGRSSNGLKEWKNEEGTTLKELESRKTEDF